MDAPTIVSLIIGSLGLLVAIVVAFLQYQQNKSLTERMIRIEEDRRLDEIRKHKGADIEAQIIFDETEGTDWLKIRSNGPGGAKDIRVEPLDEQFASAAGLGVIPILEPGGTHLFRFMIYEHPARATELRITWTDPSGTRAEVITTGFRRQNPLQRPSFLHRFRR